MYEPETKIHQDSLCSYSGPSLLHKNCPAQLYDMLVEMKYTEDKHWI